jgi:hypothetical protein
MANIPFSPVSPFVTGGETGNDNNYREKMKQTQRAFAVVATEGTHAGYFAASSLKRTDTEEDNLTLDPVKMRLYSTESGAETFIRSHSYRKFVERGVLQVKPVIVTVELV